MSDLRRKDRGISEIEAMAVLNAAEYGVLCTVDESGYPYAVPLNYCLIDRSIYFHCAVEGKKIENIQCSNVVSFCAVGNTRIIPDKLSTIYESVIVSGKINEVFDSEKQIALEGILRKYSPAFIGKGIEYIKEHKKQTRVFRIHINQITGKARR